MAAEEVAMAYALGAVERAMKVQEVILRAVDGKLTWLQAADILGRSPRSIRRLRWKLEHFGYDGLFDRRRQTPSPKRAPLAEIQHLLALYRDRYQGFQRPPLSSARPPAARRALLLRLRETGAPDRGLGRQTSTPRPPSPPPRAPPVLGELLHLDGSRHQWLALVPELWLTMIVSVDDATKQVLYAELREAAKASPPS